MLLPSSPASKHTFGCLPSVRTTIPLLCRKSRCICTVCLHELLGLSVLHSIAASSQADQRMLCHRMLRVLCSAAWTAASTSSTTTSPGNSSSFTLSS